MKNRVIFTFLAFFYSNIIIFAQEAVVDTTNVQYKIGYKIGTYLPIAILILLAVFFITRAYRFKE